MVLLCLWYLSTHEYKKRRPYWHPQGVSIRTYWHPLEIIMELLNQLILNLSRVQGVLQGVLQGYYVMILLGVLQWVAI